MRERFVVAVALLASGCLSNAVPQASPVEAPESKPAPAPVVTISFHPECDAGDEAWIRRVVPALLGRQPFGVREIRFLSDLARQAGRRSVALSLMRLPEFDARWSAFLIDDVRVERAGFRQQEECFGRPLLAKDDAKLASFIRDHGPRDKWSGGRFNMADVLASSLHLDDLTPFFRSQVFPALTRPLVFCSNLSEGENDLNRRRAFANSFAQVYLHRNIGCAECHNEQNSPTMTSDAKTNRFWPPPGEFELALWANRKGRPADEPNAVFRGLGVVTLNDETDMSKPRPANEVEPWGMSDVCGAFVPPEAIQDDPDAVKGYLGKSLGLRASIWDLESQLDDGVAALRKSRRPFELDKTSPDGAVGIASLLTQSIVQDIWAEVFGAPLTIAHGFPRNQAQRDLLVEYTQKFVDSGWSLKTLLADFVMHPLFNMKAPSDRCDASAYDLPAVMNPWSFDDVDPSRKPNGAGDGLKRTNARALLSAVSSALDWPPPQAFPAIEEAQFQAGVGAWLDRTRQGIADPDFQGLLQWEQRFGTCEPPKSIRHDTPNPNLSVMQCAGRCDSMKSMQNDGKGCSCDLACSVIHDCCSDYVAACTTDLPPSPPDWIDHLMTTAEGWSKKNPDSRATLRDLVAAVRDRLLSEPALTPSSEPLVKDFFGVQSLDTPVDANAEATEVRLRLYCGVLLKTPQFQLNGVPLGGESTVEPRLVVSGNEYADFCRRMAPGLRAATGRTLSCRADGLSIGNAR